MAQDLKRPLLFDVKQVKRPPIVLVSPKECSKLNQQHRAGEDDPKDSSEGSRDAEKPIPAGVLPIIRSPRPEKPVYIPQATKTPAYFRWKPKPIPNAPTKQAIRWETSPQRGSHGLSPRVQATQQKWNQSHSLQPSLRELDQLGPSLFEVAQDNEEIAAFVSAVKSPAVTLFAPSPSISDPSTPTSSTRNDSHSANVTESKLFQYTREQPTGTIQATEAVLTQACVRRASADTHRQPATDTVRREVQAGSVSVPVSVPVSDSATSPQPTSVVSPITPLVSPSKATTSSSAQEKKNEEVPGSDSSDDDSDDGSDDDGDMENDRAAADSVSVAIEFHTTNCQPQEKVIAQHVLRGKILRKYLHVNNLARKLKETEQALRMAALHGGLPSQRGGGYLFSRSFISRPAPASSTTPPANVKTNMIDLLGEENASNFLSEQLPVLRRLSSIDQAINKTVKRIRRLSGIEDPAQNRGRKASVAVPPSTPPQIRTKFQSIKGIGGSKQSPSSKSGRFQGVDAGHTRPNGPLRTINDTDDEHGDIEDFEDDDEADTEPAVDVKMDPSSAHMMRICQHVIAKRTIKAFLRQEMSVITIIEVSLRDDAALLPKCMIATALRPTFNGGDTSQPGARLSRPSVAGAEASDDPFDVMYRSPVKAMSAELLEAVAVYIREGDQHLTIEELFLAALNAERGKLWKRAILLASACVVVDREFILAILLRARCCRRLGLWVQAIKDLTHAILLRPDEYRLVLLRSCHHVKMNELDNALVDVNRALHFHPKSIDALLLRADIAHRQNAIGASLQDLTTALLYDPGCWRAYYDRATIRIQAVEGGDEQSFNYHWEHMKYEKLLASIIEDYVNALRKGCQMIEVVETIGDLTIRLLEFTGDSNVLRQVINNLSHLLQILSHDLRRSFHVANASNAAGGASRGAMSQSAAAAASMAASQGTIGGLSCTNKDGQERSAELMREQLVAAIHAQRGRLYVLLNDRAAALADFDQSVVTEYHYPIAHFYRGAFAALLAKDKQDEEATRANMQHLNRCISLDPTVAGAYTVRGALYLRDLKFNNALQDFKAAVATDPTLYEVWLQIALIYLNHYHDCDECIKACSSALTNDSCLARALYLRGEAYTRQGNIRAALRDYGRLTIAQPDDRWAQLMRGRLLLQMKLARPALYAFIQFMELGAYAHEKNGSSGSASDKRAHLLCGRAYKILLRFQQAVEQFQHAVRLNPTSENLVLLSESLHSMGDTENSLRVSEKVINADPGSYKGYVRRAQLLVTVGQFQLAVAEYDKALFLAPKEGRVYYERGIVQMQLYMRWRVGFKLNFEDKKASQTTAKKLQHRKRLPFEPRIPVIEVEGTLGTEHINDEKTVMSQMKACYVGAIGDFCKCIRLEPSLAEPYVDRAELYLLGEDYDKAFHDFESAIGRNPKCVRAYVNLGVLKCQFTAFAAAITDFDQAIRCDPKHTLAYFNRAVAYQKLKLWRHAERSYTLCIELSGTGRDIDAHRNRAITRCHTSSFEDALRDFDEVRQSAPDDDQLHGGLGYVLLQLGRYEDAARCFATYGRLNRDTFADSGNAYFNLGATQSHLDEKKHRAYLQTALRFYVRAARLHPSNLDIRLNIANCLRRMNEPWKAITQCESIHKARGLHHACLESKALAYYQMHRLEEGVEWMNAAIRTCGASSSALENIFYAFASQSIHRNALERKTVSSKGTRPTNSRNEQRSPNKSASTSMVEAMSAHLQELRETRIIEAATEGDGTSKPVQRPPTNVSEVILTGSSKQMLSLYMMNRGIMYEKLGQWDDAMRDYKDALHFDPLSINALLCIATLLFMQVKYPESRESFEKALNLEPKNGLAHLNLGVVLLSLDDVDGALEHFEVAIQELPSCSYGYANKAVALARKGDLSRAEHEFKRAIEELPSQKEYYLARGKIIAQQKRVQDAMVDFSTALYLGYEGKL